MGLNVYGPSAIIITITINKYIDTQHMHNIRTTRLVNTMAWNDKRPMSPHLQIYKLPFTAVLSILHRATGVALSAGVFLLVWTLAMAASGPEAYQTAQALLTSWFGYLVLMGFTAAFYYHLCTGIRHLFWDLGKGLERHQTKLSGWLILVVSSILTLLTWLIAFFG